jgi:glutathione S-transferase
MKIYVDEDGTAPSPRRVRMYLAEKGVDVLYEKLELHKANRTPDFRRKNPVGTLPVLELDDGTCISESVAICRYFEEVHPSPPLFGTTPREKAEVEMWTRRVEHYLYLPIDLGAHFARSPHSREAAAEFGSWAALSVRFLDDVVRGRDFIAGGSITMADIFAFGALDYGVRFAGFSLPGELSHLQSWYVSMAARPSARA